MVCANDQFRQNFDSEPLNKVVCETFIEMCPSQRVDHLLCNPVQAIRFCNVVRARTQSKVLDRAILRTLLKTREDS